MSVKIYGKGKKIARLRRHNRLRKKVVGTYYNINWHDEMNDVRDMIKVYNPHFNLRDKDVREIILKAKAAGITAVVFDRGGNKYHGRIAAVAEGAREGGLQL